MHCCPSAEDLRACTGVRRALVPAGVLCAGVGESHAAVGRVQRVQRLHQRRRQRVQEAAAVEMGALQAPGAGDWLVQHAAQLGRVGSGQSGIAGVRDERGGAGDTCRADEGGCFMKIKTALARIGDGFEDYPMPDKGRGCWTIRKFFFCNVDFDLT